MKIAEKDLTLFAAQSLLKNLQEEKIEATVSITIETKDKVCFEKSDGKYEQLTINDVDNATEEDPAADDEEATTNNDEEDADGESAEV